MKLSIVIVNYFSAALISDCLQSIFLYNSPAELEIIVVSNSAWDSDQDKLLSQFPAVRWLQMPYNAGFARANNAGMRAANAEVILLLNPDTLAIDDSLTRCVNLFTSSSAAACGVQLLNEDMSPQISGNFFMKGGMNHLLPLPYWGSFLRWIAFRLHAKIPNVPKAGAAEKVDWISGAFLMVKKSAIAKAGWMDEDFFLYAEEVEWCSRLQKVGELIIFGDLHFVHLQGEVINKDQNSTQKGYAGLFDKKGLQVMLSNHVRIRKQFGVGWFLFILLNYTWGIIVFAFGSFIHCLFTLRNPFGDWLKVMAFAKNVFAIWKLAPVIIRNKPYFYKVL